MSAETMDWLRNNVRIGYTSEDGPAWWAAENHMTDGTHFDGPVPIEEVRNILSVPLVEAKLYATYTSANGGSEIANGDGRKAVVRQDTGDIIGIFKSGYQIHDYTEWMLGKVASVLDTNSADLSAKSVGLLRNGAQAWLQIKLNQDFEVNGYGFVPFFTAATSADGSLASQFALGIDAAVCDNTLGYALMNAVAKTKIKHTMNSVSSDKSAEIRDAIGLLFAVKDGFEQTAKELMNTPVTEADFNAWLDMTVPVPEVKDGARGTRGQTIATNKRNALSDLYFTDAKVAPWNGTAFGVLQADNTYRTWQGTVRGADGGRMERYFSNMVDGTTSDADAAALKALSSVLNRQLVAV